MVEMGKQKGSFCSLISESVAELAVQLEKDVGGNGSVGE